MPDADDYDFVPYDDRPVAETHPDRLFVAARARGLQTTHPEHARILELGCAHAVNLIPIAAALPGARVLGIDRSARQIERATQHVHTAGLRNLEVRCADVMTLDLANERFDYIIAHGLLSWVPDPVRDRVLALGHELLAPHGVMYVSYNAMPAWGLRGGIRRALLELVDTTAPPHARVAQARAALAWLAEAAHGEGTAEHALLREEIDSLADCGDAYLLHEYLVEHARAYWLRELLELATNAGLAWISDVAPTGLTPDEHRIALTHIDTRTDDPIARAQLFDIVAHRQFRATLLGHTATPRVIPSPIELLQPLHVAATESNAATGDDAIVTALRATWPRDHPFAVLAAHATDPTALADDLLRAWEDGRVALRPRALPIASAVADAPRVAAVTRAEAERQRFVTTAFHACAPLDPFHARLVALLDGTRSRAALVAALDDDLRVGRLTADAPPVAISAALPRLVDAALARMLAAGLLVEPA